ncbi:uncharacterized protein ALTATR162_LOCUS12043 [Alternaria atra]|uniref:Uncharacterized protein n=1 Tax=Alternaria atra TaxID=119953 RepID=A0A8J2IC83_9PLEO|nr:uncharacterized protein ALTATR162_LOCUS12043 [Alternaria atra]CAG5188842.1 unnamed protein product [Alternaria atra]
MLHNARPDGTWYFSGPEGQGNSARGFPITHASYPPYVRTQLDEQIDDVFLSQHYNSSSTAYQTGSSQFRVTPHTNLTRLLERFARAAIHMLALKEAVIWSPLNWRITDDRDAGIDYWTKNGEEDDYIDERAARSGNLAWGIAYAGPGRRANTSLCRRLEWLVGPWRPDGELHGLFQEIGRMKHGEELEKFWTTDVTDDDGIGYRDWLEDSMMFGVDMGCVPVTH